MIRLWGGRRRRTVDRHHVIDEDDLAPTAAKRLNGNTEAESAPAGTVTDSLSCRRSPDRVAQLAEQRTFNPQVVGSMPTPVTKRCNELAPVDVWPGLVAGAQAVPKLVESKSGAARDRAAHARALGDELSGDRGHGAA
jgi:hypothetical protein